MPSRLDESHHIFGKKLYPFIERRTDPLARSKEESRTSSAVAVELVEEVMLCYGCRGD